MKYAAYLLTLGLAQFALAGLYGGAVVWLWLWSGFAFLLAGIAYAGNWPGVFGKRADGTMKVVNVVALLPFLLLTWGVWWLKTRLSREEAWHAVAPGLWLGRRIAPEQLPSGVGLVVDLTAEFPAPRALVRGGIAYRCLPTLDYTAPQAAALAELLESVTAYGDGVYVHCALGHGRSAMVVAGLLIVRGLAMDAAQAEKVLRGVRAGVRLNQSQQRTLTNWAKDTIDEKSVGA